MFLPFGLEIGVLVLEGEDHADPGEVEAGLEQSADAMEPVEVIGAVAAGSAGGAFRFKQSTCFVGSQVLDACSRQFRGDRDPVHRAVGVGRERPGHRYLGSTWRVFDGCYLHPRLFDVRTNL